MLRRLASALLPDAARPALRAARQRLRARLHAGDRVQCPCCGGRFRGFLAAGVGARAGAECPGCGAFERHRTLWLYLEERTPLLRERLRVLHVAPEPVLQRRLAALPALDYVSADLASPHARQHFDVTAIPFPDASFDAILCIHVLEHVPDDRRALRELCRVLRPQGFALLQVPLDPALARTDEDPAVRDPRERERRFGQADHVRRYGLDYAERLAEAGFAVTRDRFAFEQPPERVAAHGLALEEVYRCRRGDAVPRRC